MYFNLNRTIDRVANGEVPVIKFFNVVDGNAQISVLLVENECLIYSFDYSDILIPELSTALEFGRFNRYQFFGMKNVIDALFRLHNVRYSEQKHRVYYSCSELAENFNLSEGELQMADPNRLTELVELGDQFAQEFYEGQKPFENSELAMMAGIRKGNLFQWVEGEDLVGIAQINYDQFEVPVLGFVYTHPDYRGNGIGSSIAFKITEGLLNQNHEKVRLMTDANNPSSNRAFTKVGYVADGEYVVRFKEE